MKLIGHFQSARWGRVSVLRGQYREGQTAVALEDSDGQALTTLSVNMYRPASDQDSRDLPENCFYVKAWSENEELAREAAPLFILRGDLPRANSGFVYADVWEIKS